MSAAAQAPVPTMAPDPSGANASMPARIGRVLSVLRKLIDYGKQLATAIQQRVGAPGCAFLARPFATADLAVILARITSGLLRAAALEAGLCRRAARGRDLTPTSLRPTALYRPRPPRQVAPPNSLPADAAEDRRLARLPTEEAIAAEVRRRPVGAVIVDICRDLGIRPGDCDRAFWDELCHAIIAYGGSLAGFLNGPNRWLTAHGSDDQADPTWPPAPPRPPPLATGPPSRT